MEGIDGTLNIKKSTEIKMRLRKHLKFWLINLFFEQE